MIPCNKNHVQIWHMERFCPLCTAIRLVEIERMYIENLKKDVTKYLFQKNIEKVFGKEE